MKFIFDTYEMNQKTGQAKFFYKFSDGRKFVEKLQFKTEKDLSPTEVQVLDRAMFLAFVLLGTSYYKTFAGCEVKMSKKLDLWQAKFFTKVYHEGLGQYAYENKLRQDDLAKFEGSGKTTTALKYDGEGYLLAQSGGKDSLLVADLIEKQGLRYTPFIVTSGESHPKILDGLSEELVVVHRSIDRTSLMQAEKDGAMNGHVPVTYMMMSISIIQMILLGKKYSLFGIGHEAAEANTWLMDGMEVNHQWSKSWQAEEDFARYVNDYISEDIFIGSPIRGLSEMRIAELFEREAWGRFGHGFSSCNVANYRQHADNSKLKWCGNCPKCANSYLIFAPFVRGEELRSLFGGQELFGKESLNHAFAGLLGIDGVMKPFECVGEIEELRRAYGLSQVSGDYGRLSFSVPESTFDWHQEYEGQTWAKDLISSLTR